MMYRLMSTHAGGLFVYSRLITLFILICLVFQFIRIAYWFVSGQENDPNFSYPPKIQPYSSNYKAKIKFVDADPEIRALEDYIFRRDSWTFPAVNTQPINTSVIKFARISDKYDLELIPKVNVSEQINCKKFIENDTNYMAVGRRFMDAHAKEEDRHVSFVRRTKYGCGEFIHERRYVTSPMTKDEETFPIAFGIVVYKDIEMVERLLRAIYRPQNYYCIHVDAKSADLFFEEIMALTRCFDNVFVASRRIDVRWGTLSLLMSDLLCMRDLLPYKWRYYINLTGQEFPLRNNYELVQVLRTFRGGNDLESTFKARNEERYKSIHDVNGRSTGYVLPAVPLNITVVKGNMHGALSRGFVDFLLNDPKSKMFYDWVKQTGMPEETYYATINSNPHLGAPGSFTGQNLERYQLVSREIRWYRDCGGKLVRGVCVNGIADLKRLTQSRKLFLNKFHLDFEYLAFDCFEKWFYDRSRLTYSGKKGFELGFYSRLEAIRKALRRDTKTMHS